MPEVEISYDIDIGTTLTKELVEVARSQGENDEMTCEKIQQLKDMFYERGKCIPQRLDDAFLIKFLRARFWDVENTYKLICRYHQFREDNPTLITGVRPLSFTKIGDEQILNVLPYKDQNGRRMIIFKIGNWTPSKIPIDDLFRATMILTEIASMEQSIQVLGGIVIFDLEGLALTHAWQMSPSVAQKLVDLMVTASPTRIAAIHIVNQPWTFDGLFQIFKPFLNERMRARIFMHGSDQKSLHKHIHPTHLPLKYGGVFPEFPYKDWLVSLSKLDRVKDEMAAAGYTVDEDTLEFVQKAIRDRS